ncbi:MAG TPA: DUF4350 domain-containing protein [Pyrinomonadaceae bacterium]|jgi:hypothetical protein|nr:DUF4350 domain-containing protein [Pyrinomonadaceae bacterium]
MKPLVLICALLLACITAVSQQFADPEFNTSVENPVYKKDGPRVMFDEAHHNFHTTEGRYKPFVDVLMNDGYRVIRNRQSFSKTRLDSFKILVIANALGAEEDDDEGADKSAFNDDEIEAVHDWVKSGGALLLIADHAPFGGAAAALAKRFGVEMSMGYTFDQENAVAGSPTQLIFSHENKLLGSHSIIEGRNENERIKLLRSFTGQSLKGPEGSTSILSLANSATDRPNYASETSVSAAGRSQAVAFKFGKGRVLVQGEAAMLSAQISGADKHPMGMNVPGNDNKQYVLNLMHWLSGILK